MKNEKGIILPLTYVFMIILALAVTGFLYAKAVQSRFSGVETSSARAFWVAEAGMQKYLYLLKTSQTQRDTYPQLTENFGAGNYTVSALFDGAHVYSLTSTGTVGGVSRKIEQSVDVYESPEAFAYGMYTDGKIQFQSVDKFIIDGDITAADTITYPPTQVTINGDVNQNLDKEFPAVDYNFFRSIADNVVTGNKTFAAGTYSGIWYVTGSVVIPQGVTINGSVIAESNIDLKDTSGAAYINAATGRPALVSKANINIVQDISVTINGLVFCEGTVLFQNSQKGTVNGAILGGSSLKFQNSDDWYVNYDENLMKGLEGFTSSSMNALVVPRKDWEETAAQ